MLSLRLLKGQWGHAIRTATRYPAASAGADESQEIEKQIKAKNAFRLFNLEEKMKIDERKLKQEMHKLQRTFHPDKIVSSGRQRTEKTDQISTVVNHSYQTLKDPYKRAKYLLEVKLNKPPDDIERTLDELKLDQDFLDRMMEIRERIARDDKPYLYRLVSQIESELDEVIVEIDKDFRAENYRLVLNGLGKLKFLANCRSALRDKVGDDI